MLTHSLTQGTPAWHLHRATHFNASDAPAMMGCSPYKTRSQLLHELHTGLTPEVDASTQRRFDDGHRFEAMARPLAEDIIGEDLYPVTGSLGKLSASFDGLTLMEDTAFEHKTLNAELRALLVDDCLGSELPIQYRVQMEHQCMVSGSSRVLFMASKWEGDMLVEARHCWYTPDPDLLAAIGAGWNQFEADLAAYVPSEIKEMPQGEVTVDLPALFIHAKGEITTNNMPEYGLALEAKMKAIRSIVLVSDQDFANAKTAAAQLRDSIEKAKLAKAAMLAQTVTVGEAALMIDAWCENMRLTALQLETDVKREDQNKKALIVSTAKGKYDEHVRALLKELAPLTMPLAAPVFAEALKNKRSYTSMQDAVETMLANSKISADAMAGDYSAKKAWFATASAGYTNLFADLQQLVAKPVDDFQMVVTSRVDAQKVKDQKIKDNAAAKALADKQAADDAAAVATPISEPKEALAPTPQAESAIETIAKAPNVISIVRPPAVAPTAPVTPPTLKLGQIGERLGFNLTGDFLKSLGFEPAARDKSALLFHEASFSLICAALVAHIEQVQAKQAA